MARFSETVDIKRPPEEVWRVLGQPERWFEGYLETRSRSPEYPAPDTRNDHLYRTRMREEVEVRVTRSEAPTLLEETQQGRTFARRVRYRLSPAPEGTLLRLEDTIVFKGLGKVAAPIASRDVRNRWATSLERLKAAVEAGEQPPLVDDRSYRAELEAPPTKEVYLRARRRAARRLDVRFFWTPP